MSFCVIASLSSCRQDGDVTLCFSSFSLSALPPFLPLSVSHQGGLYEIVELSLSARGWECREGVGGEVAVIPHVFCSSGFGDAALCVFTDFLPVQAGRRREREEAGGGRMSVVLGEGKAVVG